jgi:hypothetical protein
MARGAPDWTRQVQVVITEGQPKNERAAGDVGRYTGTDTTYQELASWTVAADYIGELKEIIIVSSNYDKTQCKVTVGAVVYATDWQVVSPVPLIFEDLRLAEATVVKVETKSTDGTSITVDAVIVGKEVG